VELIQSKMARAALGWRREDLAQHANISHSTVYAYERGVKVRADSVKAMRKALINTGKIEFLGNSAVNYKISE
jgi:transcriptional regulator with XRE-family HTH domain